MIKQTTQTCLVLVLTLAVSVLCLVSHQPPVEAAETAAADNGLALPDVPKGLSQEEIRDLIVRLSDDDVRQLLIAELDRQARGV